MGEETARLREEIDQTREDLTRDVDLLAEKTSPSRIVERRVQRTREGIGRGVTGLKEKIMGSPSADRHATYGPTYGYAEDSSGGVSEKLQSARESTMSAAGQAKEQVTHAGERAQEAAQGAVSNVREQAEGNPLAAGVIAFGIGWLVSSLMPVSEAEQEAARRATDAAREHGAPVVEQAKHVAQEVASGVGQELQGHVQEAAQQVKEQAQDAAGSVKEAATTS